jgi:hypothetical protein
MKSELGKRFPDATLSEIEDAIGCGIREGADAAATAKIAADRLEGK